MSEFVESGEQQELNKSPIWDNLRTKAARCERDRLIEEERGYVNKMSDILVRNIRDITFFGKPIGGFVEGRTPPDYNWAVNLGGEQRNLEIADAAEIYKIREKFLDPLLKELLNRELGCNAVFILALPTLTDFGLSEDDVNFQDYKKDSVGEAVIFAKFAVPTNSACEIQEERAVVAHFAMRIKYPVAVRNIFLDKDHLYLLHFILQHTAMKFDPAYSVFFDGSMSGAKLFGENEKDRPTIAVVDEKNLRVRLGSERKKAEGAGSYDISSMYEHLARQIPVRASQSFGPLAFRNNRGVGNEPERQFYANFPKPPVIKKN